MQHGGHQTGEGRLSRIREAFARRKAGNEDSGQALVMAVIAIAVIAVLVPIVGSNLDAETVQVNRASLSEAALAAAKAGLNDYRTYIDSNPAYYAFVCGTPHTNMALGAGSPTYACNTWQPVSGTTNEWFHYVPDDSQLTQTASTSGSPKEMLLEVTGRAGAPGDYTYRTILAGFTLSGILTDSYYSDYEVTDPAQPGAYPTVTVTPSGGSPQTYAMSAVQVQYAEQTGAGSYSYYGPENLIDALCEYHTYSENTFIDSLGTVTNQWIPGKPIASFTNPYYGPFYDAPPLTFTIPNKLPNGNTPVNAGATIAITSGTAVCGVLGQGIYNGAVTFNGIAYTNDQLAFCGNPTFNGNPPIESGAPTLPYKDDWPGSAYETPSNGPAGYYPKGYTYSFSDGCSANSQPNYGPTVSNRAPVLNQNQALPPTVSALEPFADGQQVGSVGCLYTGPTMVQFLPGGLMNVWSPLSQNTNPQGSVAQQQACGTFSPGQPYQMGLAVPQAANGGGGVIYVEGEQSTGPNSGWQSSPTAGTPCSASLTTGCVPPIISTACSSYSSASPPPAWEIDINVCVPSGATYISEGQALNPAVTSPPAGDSKITVASCMDPYFPNTTKGGVETDPGTGANASATCEEGDAIVEGELRGLLTLAATNDIIVSRDLTYQCVDSSGVSNANPGTTAACNSAGTNDELALVPQNETILSMALNEPYNTGGCNSGNCSTAAAPICADDGTSATQNITNVVPWSCDTDTNFAGGLGGNGIVIDAAVVDLYGGTIAQNFNIASVNGSASMFQDGTNINYFAGLNGAGSDGYNQVITYDQRLAYENPPGLLVATNTVWNISSYVVCGTVNSATFAVQNSGTATAYQQINCPNQA